VVAAKRETTGTTDAPDFPTAAAVVEGIHAVWYLIRDPWPGSGFHSQSACPVVSRFARDHRLPYVTPSGVGIARCFTKSVNRYWPSGVV